MNNINLIRPRYIESLIVPSEGSILMSYLSHNSSLKTYSSIPPRRERSSHSVRTIGVRDSELDYKIENTEVLDRIFTNAVSTKENAEPRKTKKRNIPHSLGLLLLALSLGGIVGPLIPTLRLEAGYMIDQMKTSIVQTVESSPILPPSAPTIFDPLIKPDGEKIEPVNTDFSVIVPKVGINAPVTADINPKSEASYLPALAKGVAHASTSFLPDQDGTVYLFSHSTNYDWFAKDLNAVFYHLKSLDSGDLIVVVYKNTRYTYKLREKKVVAPNEISYLIPQHGTKTLILQTCWPPGSTTERLLIFADLIDSTLLTL